MLNWYKDITSYLRGMHTYNSRVEAHSVRRTAQHNSCITATCMG